MAACSAQSEQNLPVVLDLADTTFMDTDGYRSMTLGCNELGNVDGTFEACNQVGQLARFIEKIEDWARSRRTSPDHRKREVKYHRLLGGVFITMTAVSRSRTHHVRRVWRASWRASCALYAGSDPSLVDIKMSTRSGADPSAPAGKPKHSPTRSQRAARWRHRTVGRRWPRRSVVGRPRCVNQVWEGARQGSVQRLQPRTIHFKRTTCPTTRFASAQW